MVKVGDWVVIRNLDSYKDFREGKVMRLYGVLADVYMDELGVTWHIPAKNLFKTRKEVSKEEYINASLDLNMKDWFMALTGENND